MALRPSFWERAYLIWTFRNFRELSPPLLNPRQLALVKTLADRNANSASRSYDPSQVIGVVDFSTSATKILAPRPMPNKPEPARPLLAKSELFKAALSEPELSKEPLVKSRGSSVQLRVPRGFRFSSTLNQSLPKPEPYEARPRREVEAARPAIPASPSSKRRYSFLTAPSIRLKSTKSLAIPLLEIAACVSLLCIGLFVVAHRARSPIQLLAHRSPSQSSSMVAPVPKAAQPTLVATAAPSMPAAGVTPSPAVTKISAGPEAVLDVAAIRAAASISPPPTTSRRLPLRKKNRGAHPTLSLQGIPTLATRPPLRFKYPEYSDIGARGEVALTAEVNSDGTVRSVRILSGNRALAAVAVRAVRKWRYPPYLKNGEPVATETNIVVSFFSDDAVSMSFPPTISARR